MDRASSSARLEICIMWRVADRWWLVVVLVLLVVGVQLETVSTMRQSVEGKKKIARNIGRRVHELD
jgi:hypothetical protein